MSLGGSSQIHPAGGEDEADAEPADAASAPALSPDARARRSMELYEETQAKYAVSTEEKAALEREEIEAIVEAMAQRVKQPYFLLLPESKYIQRWDLVTLGALIFTAFVTPYEVALLESPETWGEVDALFFVNRFIDLIFFKDMVMNFFLAFRDTSQDTRGRLVKDLPSIRRRYLRSWFTLDLVSILPFDILGMSFDSDVVSSLKIIRVIRLLRLPKLVRILRASRIFKRFESRISVSYSVIGLMNFSLLLLVTGHWMACFWAMGARMGGEDSYTWLHALCVRRELVWANTTEANAYAAHLAAGGNTADDDIAELLADDDDAFVCAHAWHHGEQYSAALYWAIVTITSVGYGDITPTNSSEMRLTICCLLIGGVVWAYIIGNACGIVSTLDVGTIKHRQRMDQLNYFMADQNMPDSLRVTLRGYFQAMRTMLKNDSYNAMIEMMSPMLRAEVSLQKAGWLNQIWYLSGCSEKFIVQISMQLGSTLFIPQETIGFRDALMIMSRGVASRAGRVKTPGALWGEDFILQGGELKDRTPCTSLTYAEILALERDDFYATLSGLDYDAERAIVRTACVRLSFRLAVLRITRMLRVRDRRAVDFMGQVEQAFAQSHTLTGSLAGTGEINRRGAYGSRRNLLEPDALHSFDDSSKGSASVEEPPAEPLSSKVVSVAQRLSQVDEKLELITAALTRSKNRA